MKIKTKMMADRFAKIISEWPGVECIALNEAALTDTLDPYFALILDIYYEGSIPKPDDRCKLFGDDVAAFESSGDSKDRFLINELPVRLEYKSIKPIEERIKIAVKKVESFPLIKDSGTYGFYRLANSEVIYSRGGWINDVRKKIENLGDEFWRMMRDAYQSKMEHFLSDLGAAVMLKDDFNLLISAAGFIKSACLTLFCINQVFEPSHKAYFNKVLNLPLLPESFRAEFQTFLRLSQEDGRERYFKLGKLIARRIIVLERN